MRAGEMKYRLRILQPTRATDKFGSETPTYEDVGWCHAQRVTSTGRRSEEASEHFPDYTTEFIIRDSHTIDEHWRVQQIGGHLYEVVAIIPNINRGMLTLKCERVNQ